MRNIFDQYSQPENRVTHALVTALHEDRKLLRSFLADIANCLPPRNQGPIAIFEQTYPGQLEIGEDETTRRGIPDAWVTASDDWCLVIENKVLSAATIDQLVRHLATARRLGFAEPKALILTVMEPKGAMPHGTTVAEWRNVYRWLVDKASKSYWAGQVAEFLEVMEGRMVDLQQLTAGTLTAFNGFRFDGDNPYSYLEAKRVLGLAMNELRSRNDLKSELGMDPSLSRRPAITGRDGDGVWNVLRIGTAGKAGNFAEFPHLTLGIGQKRVDAMMTIPNGFLKIASYRNKIVDVEPGGFRKLVYEILERMLLAPSATEGMEPRLRAVQRRFLSRKSEPFNDAFIDFDLRTGFDEMGPPKTQPQWIDAVYDCLANKNSNFQVQIGAHFPYRTCDAIRSANALDYIADAWIACRPLIDLLVTDNLH